MAWSVSTIVPTLGPHHSHLSPIHQSIHPLTLFIECLGGTSYWYRYWWYKSNKMKLKPLFSWSLLSCASCSGFNWSCRSPVLSFPPTLQSNVLSKMQIWPCETLLQAFHWFPIHCKINVQTSWLEDQRIALAYLYNLTTYVKILICLQQHQLIGFGYTSHAFTLLF